MFHTCGNVLLIVMLFTFVAPCVKKGPPCCICRNLPGFSCHDLSVLECNQQRQSFFMPHHRRVIGHSHCGKFMLAQCMPFLQIVTLQNNFIELLHIKLQLEFNSANKSKSRCTKFHQMNSISSGVIGYA